MSCTSLREVSLDLVADDGRVIVVGDLHGDYKSLQAICTVFRPHTDCLIFLGDYADRGPQGVEVLEGVMALRAQYPQRVIALKGNHEAYTGDGRPTFTPCDLIREVDAKRGGWSAYFRETLQPFFASLSLAALVAHQALFVHGGVSQRVAEVNDLRFPSQRVETDVLWSDPFDGEGEQANWRGAGVAFGADVSEAVCRRLRVAYIMRSHEPQKAATGPCVEHEGRVITVSATDVYGGRPFVVALPGHAVDEASTQIERHTVYLR